MNTEYLTTRAINSAHAALNDRQADPTTRRETALLFLAAAAAQIENEACTASSFRSKSKSKPYGPGGFNRCVLLGAHDVHQDDFGNRWVIEDDGRFRSVKR